MFAPRNFARRRVRGGGLCGWVLPRAFLVVFGVPNVAVGVVGSRGRSPGRVLWVARGRLRAAEPGPASIGLVPAVWSP